jgi:hypothetical protein
MSRTLRWATTASTTSVGSSLNDEAMTNPSCHVEERRLGGALADHSHIIGRPGALVSIHPSVCLYVLHKL